MPHRDGHVRVVLAAIEGSLNDVRRIVSDAMMIGVSSNPGNIASALDAGGNVRTVTLNESVFANLVEIGVLNARGELVRPMGGAPPILFESERPL